MMPEENNPIIHIARIQPHGGGIVYLLLKKTPTNWYVWFEDNDKQTSIGASNIEEAILQARQHWKYDVAFRTIGCGYRFTLPERDEHGENALFYQMAASLKAMDGRYFDVELGHVCIVHDPSEEARLLFYKYNNPLNKCQK